MLVDLVVTLAAGLMLLLASGALEHAEDYATDATPGPFLRVVLLGVAGYLLAHGAWLWRGQTLGKALLGARVVRADGAERARNGAPVGALRMMVRLPFFLLWYAPLHGDSVGGRGLRPGVAAAVLA